MRDVILHTAAGFTLKLYTTLGIAETNYAFNIRIYGLITLLCNP
jgi:hypothetical protein